MHDETDLHVSFLVGSRQCIAFMHGTAVGYARAADKCESKCGERSGTG